MKKLLAILLVLCMILSIAACGKKEAATETKTDAKTEAAPAAETLKDKAAKFDRKNQFLTVGTGPTSGIYFPIGNTTISAQVGFFGWTRTDYGDGAPSSHWVARLEARDILIGVLFNL